MMDISMPVMSGSEALEQWRSDPDTDSIPVVAVTAHVLPADHDRLPAQGFDGFVI